MSKTAKVAMVGLGFGAEFIPIYQAHPNAEVAAICRRNEAELNSLGGPEAPSSLHFQAHPSRGPSA